MTDLNKLSKSLTAEQLRQLYSYDPTTGLFTRLTKARRWPAGRVVRGEISDGYVMIRINRIRYRAHRLAWLHVMGQWPQGVVDHRNGVRSDNRWENLRDATTNINAQNLHAAPSNKKYSKILGAQWSKQRGAWQAKIRVGKQLTHLGFFETDEAAGAAYLEAKRRLHEGCTL